MPGQIWVSIGFIVYYTVFQIIDDVMRESNKTNTKSRVIEKLRSEYKVNIRTFIAIRPYAFTSFRAIWINEKVLNNRNRLVFLSYFSYHRLPYKSKLRRWLKVIWLNEVEFKVSNPLLFSFHHEHYHLVHNHKAWKLFMKFIISISPLTVFFVNWWIFIFILLSIALITDNIGIIFEEKANAYAHKKTN